MNNVISVKSLEQITVVSNRAIRHTDEEIRSAAEELYNSVPAAKRAGPPLAVYHWETIVPEGQDVEVCVPVKGEIAMEGHGIRTLRHGQGFHILAGDDPTEYGDHYRRILALMVENGIHPRSQREIFYSMEEGAAKDAGTGLIVVMHPWIELLEKGLSDTFGDAAKERIMQGGSSITPHSNLKERAEWIKGVIGRIEDESEGTGNVYRALSVCADFFPQERIDAYRSVYLERESVDDVIEFMKKEQYWYRPPYREGNTVYVTKNPRNRKAFEEAPTKDERRTHYCHCTMIRNAMDQGISPTFCYCGAGWFRQQWEGFLKRPVEIRVASTVLNGDDTCTFAIRLPEECVKEK